MYILCDWGRWGGVFLKKKGKKNPSDWLMSSRTFRQHPSVFLWLLPKKKKSCFRCFQLWLKERMCDRVHRSSRIFWRNKLAAWFFGAVPRLLGSNPARWKDEIWMTHWIHSNLRLIELKIPPASTNTTYTGRNDELCYGCVGYFIQLAFLNPSKYSTNLDYWSGLQMLQLFSLCFFFLL